MNVISYFAATALVLGVVIILHELGHFLAARYFKIRVETFSIGFGPRMVGFRRGDTDYRISWLPLGGYVKMAGDNPSETLTGDPHEFLSKPKWQRFIVAIAGPAMNIILAVVLLTGLFMYGRKVPEVLVNQAVVGFVEAGSPADQAGVRDGDRLESIDGREKPNWQDVQTRVMMNVDKPLPLVVARNGEVLTLTITPIRRKAGEMGYDGMGPHFPVIVKDVWSDPAKAAGLMAGDEITEVNGIRVSSQAMQSIVQGIHESSFPITVLRHGEAVKLRITPIEKDGRKLIGINLDTDVIGPTVMVKYGLAEAFSRSISSNKENGKIILQVIGMLFKRQAKLSEIDGPIGIVRASGQALNEGFSTLINLMALISLNLGLLNILPIPVLDGGVMLMLVVESLMGRDISLHIKERIIQVSVVALLMLMVVVLYNDVVKLIPTSTP